MTSAKSSAKPFRFTFFRTIKKNWHFPALICAVVSFLTLICGLFNEWMIYNNHSWELGKSFREWVSLNTVYILGDVGMRTELYMALLMVLAMATGIMIFRYMFSKKAVNVYYSLGISRTNMFLAKYFSGAFLLVLAVLIPLAIDVIANIAIFGSCKELWISALFYFLGATLSILFAYTVSVAVCCRVGMIIEAIIYSAVFLVAPFILSYIGEFFFRTLLYGSPLHENEWIYRWNHSEYYSTSESHYTQTGFVSNTVPFADVFYFSEQLSKSGSNMINPDFISLIPLAFLVVAVALIALVTYKKRKTEIAGFLGADELTKGLSVFLIASFISSFVFLDLIEYSPDIAVFCLCLTAVIFLVVYLFFDIITVHNIKKILGTMWKYLVHLGAVAVCIIIFSTGFFGYSSRLPDIKDVESVSVSTGTGDIMMNYDELTVMKNNAGAYDLADYYLLAGICYQGIVDGITDAEDIEYVMDIHKKFIECKGLKVNDETLNAGYGKRVLPVNIKIIYELRNGERFERMYPVATDEIMQMLSEVTKTERYKELAVKNIQKPVPKMEYSEIYDEYYYKSEPVYSIDSVTVESVAHAVSTVMPFTFRGAQVSLASPLLSNITYLPQLNGDSELKDSLLNAICADIENDNLPLNYRSDADILGYIVFNKFNPDDQNSGFNDIRYQGGTLITPEMTEPVKINVFGGEFKVFFTNRVSVPVYADMSNTINFLKINGLENYLEEVVEVSKIRIWVPDEQSVADINTYNGASMLWSGWWFNTDETCLLVPGNSVSVTDKNEIADVAKECTLMCLACYETNYAEIIFEDGSRTFAAIPIK
ncbi:MAG: hypothetical protein IKK63_01910 [Clostridia bacterium]|nr:hypothetical protein [Clostridia bacterium]